MRIRIDRASLRSYPSILFAVLLLAPLPVRAQEDDEGDTIVVPSDAPPSSDSLPFPDVIPEPALPDSVALAYDSSDVMIRRLDPKRMDRYLDDEEFQYDREERDPESLFSKILTWLYRQLMKLIGGDENADVFWRWIGGAALAYAIYLFIRSNRQGLFRWNRGRPVSDFVEVDENIHEMNFDALIDEAVAARNYRRGVRLLYLKTLKLMTDRGAIDWRIDKTNREYLRELRDNPVQKPFGDLTLMFEYVWYGDIPVSESLFRDIRARFDEFDSKLLQHS